MVVEQHRIKYVSMSIFDDLKDSGFEVNSLEFIYTKAICRLKDKALKAYFKIRDNLISNSGHCSFKLFQTLIQPILGYGCEVWAPYILKKVNDQNFLNICDKLPSESIHIKVCKLILGVFRRASNAGVRGELGSYPLLITMLCLAVNLNIGGISIVCV
jgi:hypothetical protein